MTLPKICMPLWTNSTFQVKGISRLSLLETQMGQQKVKSRIHPLPFLHFWKWHPKWHHKGVWWGLDKEFNSLTPLVRKVGLNGSLLLVRFQDAGNRTDLRLINNWVSASLKGPGYFENDKPVQCELFGLRLSKILRFTGAFSRFGRHAPVKNSLKFLPRRDRNKKHLFALRHSLWMHSPILSRNPNLSQVPFWEAGPGCPGPACRGDPWRPAGADPAPRPAAGSGSAGRRRDPGTGRRCQPATALPHADKEITATLKEKKKQIRTQCTKNITTRLLALSRWSVCSPRHRNKPRLEQKK